VKSSTKLINKGADGKPNEKAKPTSFESMLYTNISGALVAGVLALLSGHLSNGVAFCMKHSEVMSAIFWYSLASALGQTFVYYTITQFSPLLLTTVTTTRKIFSTLYSVFRNPANSLNSMQWGGCGLVFLGLAIDIVAAKMKSSSKPAAKAAGQEPTTPATGKTKRPNKIE
jgi:UDP-galactose transporter B1